MAEDLVQRSNIMYQTRDLGVCGSTEYIDVDLRTCNNRIKIALEILDSVPGLAKVMVGCYNLALVDEYIRNPPLEGPLTPSLEEMTQHANKLIEIHGYQDEMWAVEFHPTAQSEKTRFRIVDQR